MKALAWIIGTIIGLAFVGSVFGGDDKPKANVKPAATATTDDRISKELEDAAKEADKPVASGPSDKDLATLAKAIKINDRLGKLSARGERQGMNGDVVGICDTVEKMESLMERQERNIDDIRTSSLVGTDKMFDQWDDLKSNWEAVQEATTFC